jgi:carbon starvation protein
MPALTRFTDGSGPIFAGALFPFAFITIACGSISGFHALIASGTTPKLLECERDARMIGYGGMLMESFVAVMALIAACALTPGVYFAINAPVAALGPTAQTAAAAIANWGFVVTPAEIDQLAKQVGETSLLSRTGGAPSLAVGMAHLFSRSLGGSGAMALWYHFALMFEALFILTTLDAGTRVGRFMLQDLGRHVWQPFGRTGWMPAVIISSAIFVAMWGHFLWQGVVDPFGGIALLWPIFGIANQLLAAVALCVGTTIIIKMGRARYAAVTGVPLAWLVVITMTAGWQRVFDAEPRIGLLAQARHIAETLAAGKLPAGASSASDAARIIWNARLDAAVIVFFMISVLLIVADSSREWWSVLRGHKPAVSTEVPFEPRAFAAGD